MRIFKIADFFISLCLIIGSGIAALYDTSAILYGMFITGGWQLISMLIHLQNGWFKPKGNLRLPYHRLALIVIVLGTIATLANLFFLFYNLMVVLAPVLAIIYLSICYIEIRILKIRPLGLYK
jgi:hypothetical protein